MTIGQVIDNFVSMLYVGKRDNNKSMEESSRYGCGGDHINNNHDKCKALGGSYSKKGKRDTVKCNCGSEIVPNGVKKHLQTIKHKKYMDILAKRNTSIL